MFSCCRSVKYSYLQHSLKCSVIFWSKQILYGAPLPLGTGVWFFLHVLLVLWSFPQVLCFPPLVQRQAGLDRLISITKLSRVCVRMCNGFGTSSRVSLKSSGIAFRLPVMLHRISSSKKWTDGYIYIRISIEKYCYDTCCLRPEFCHLVQTE